jgi:hypothetical protein
MLSNYLFKVSGFKIKLIVHLCIFCSGTLCNAQANVFSVQFNPVFGAHPFETEKKYSYKKDSIQITTLKFYVSGIQLYKDSTLLEAPYKKYHLIDIDNPQSLHIFYSEKMWDQFNRIRFSVGVDSVTNVSGALGGDLDPTNGMYWTWQSGYINFKLEGNYKPCPSRKNQFIFHIGGYQYPNNSIQKIDLPTNGQKKIMININIQQLLDEINLEEFYEVMSPGEKAMDIAKKISSIFYTAK